MTRSSFLAVAGVAAIAFSCTLDDATHAQGAAAQPRVLFYARPLNPADDTLANRPVRSWSQNDDHDSISIVVSGFEDSATVAVATEAFIEFIDWQADTTTGPGLGRWVPLNLGRTSHVDHLPARAASGSGRTALVIRPSLFDSLLPSPLKTNEFITLIRATARTGRVVASDTLTLMWPGI